MWMKSYRDLHEKTLELADCSLPDVLLTILVKLMTICMQVIMILDENRGEVE